MVVAVTTSSTCQNMFLIKAMNWKYRSLKTINYLATSSETEHKSQQLPGAVDKPSYRRQNIGNKFWLKNEAVRYFCSTVICTTRFNKQNKNMFTFQSKRRHGK